MSRRVRLSTSARRDISQALGWTFDHFGQKQHDQYLRLIGLALQEIATRPSGQGTKLRPEVQPDARTLHIARRGKKARHFFVYRLNADGGVDVARFLHDAMELSRHLPDVWLPDT